MPEFMLDAVYPLTKSLSTVLAFESLNHQVGRLEMSIKAEVLAEALVASLICAKESLLIAL